MTLAGYTESFGEGGSDYFLVKTDSLGNEEWNQAYGTEANDYGYDVIHTRDGGFLLGGYTYSQYFQGDYYIVRTDSEGDILWERIYSDDELGIHGLLKSVIQVEDGGFVLAGDGGRIRPRNHDDFLIIRTDSLGEILWYTAYGGRGTEWCYEALATPDGGYAFAGITQSMGATGNNFWLLKTTPDPLLVPRLVDPNYACPHEFVLHSPYPNPFNSATKIEFQLPFRTHVNLTIHDQLGKQVAILLDQSLSPGTHEVQWETSNEPSGPYICMFDADGFRISRQVLLVK